MSLRAHWTLDPSVTFLNHGSFGACPRAVLEEQSRWRARMEAEPVRFFIRELEPALDRARAAAAAFLECNADDLAFVPNATHGVNTVLRSLSFAEGDELLVTDHAYNACRNALDFTAAKFGAKVVVAKIPFPVRSADEAFEAVVSLATPRTKLSLLDWVTSPTGLLLPIPELVRELSRRGVDSIVDAAHVPGMIPARLSALNAAYVTGNFHKWACAPKGAAFLFVRRDRQSFIRPLAVSHGANSPRKDRSSFRLEFDWTGTDDPSAFLSVPAAIDFIGSLLPGGWPEVMRRNHALAVEARGLLCEALGAVPPCPDDMLGSLASLPIPDGPGQPGRYGTSIDPLQEALFSEEHIEVPVMPWPKPPQRLLRISAALYNERSEYERLAAAVKRRLTARGA